MQKRLSYLERRRCSRTHCSQLVLLWNTSAPPHSPLIFIPLFFPTSLCRRLRPICILLRCSLNLVLPASDSSIHEKCDVSRSSVTRCRPPTHSPGAAGVRGMFVILQPRSPSVPGFCAFFLHPDCQFGLSTLAFFSIPASELRGQWIWALSAVSNLLMLRLCKTSEWRRRDVDVVLPRVFWFVSGTLLCIQYVHRETFSRVFVFVCGSAVSVCSVAGTLGACWAVVRWCVQELF